MWVLVAYAAVSFCNASNKSAVVCLLCPESAAQPARRNATYIVSSRCEWPGFGGVLQLPGGVYTMAELQQLRGYYMDGDEKVPTNAVVDGAIRIDSNDCTIDSVSTTTRIDVRGATAHRTRVTGVTVTEDTVGVVVRNPVGADTIDVDGSTFSDVSIDNAGVEIALVHTVGDATVECPTKATVMAIPFNDDQSVQTTEKCSVVDLAVPFDGQASEGLRDLGHGGVA